MFKLEIKTSGSAYSEYDESGNVTTLYGNEIARQLRILADHFDSLVSYNDEEGSVNDINGNKTCIWELNLDR